VAERSREQVMGKGAILGDFCPTPVLPRWLTMSELNQSWCVSSLLMADYYCDVRKFWLSFIMDKNPFFGLKILPK